jgi:hypothetical protein
VAPAVTTASAALRLGVRLAGSVLGVGMLLVPPVALGLAGTAAPAAWLVHLALGASVAVALGLLARSRPEGSGFIADLTGSVLGTWARHTVLALYLAGFVGGQAAIAVAAGGFATVALGGSNTASVVPVVAGLVLVAATAGAALGVTLGDRGRRVRLAATGVLAFVGCVRPELFVGTGLVPTGDTWFGAAVFLMFFAGVGWETTARLGPDSRGPGEFLAAVVTGVLLFGAVNVGLSWMLQSQPAGNTGTFVRAAALAATMLLGAFCLTNIAAAARFAGRLGLPGGPVAVGCGCLGVLLVANFAHWGTAELLVVPAAATMAAYLLAMAAAVRGGRTPARLFGAAALLGMIVLAVVLANQLSK